MDFSLSLFFLCSLAGMVMVAGSLFLLWKGRIYLDNKGENVSVSEIELPMGVKLKTEFPVLLMFVLGAFMLSYPIFTHPRLCPNVGFHAKTPLEMVELRGKVDSDVQVFAIAAVQKAKTAQGIELLVPYVQNRAYVIQYADAQGNPLYDEDCWPTAERKRCELNGFTLQRTRAQPSAVEGGQTLPDSTVAEFRNVNTPRGAR